MLRTVPLISLALREDGRHGACRCSGRVSMIWPGLARQRLGRGQDLLGDTADLVQLRASRRVVTRWIPADLGDDDLDPVVDLLGRQGGAAELDHGVQGEGQRDGQVDADDAGLARIRGGSCHRAHGTPPWRPATTVGVAALVRWAFTETRPARMFVGVGLGRGQVLACCRSCPAAAAAGAPASAAS